MKKISLIIVLLAVLFAVNSNYAQPKLVIHVTGGYDLPLGVLKGTWPGDATLDPVPYFMNTGFHFGADGKLYVDKKKSVGITLGLSYILFQSKDLGFTGTSLTYKSKLNMFQAALGIEYGFLPKGKANPFVGAEFTGNFMSGKITPSTTDSINVERTLKSSSRFGLNIGAGVDWHASKNVGVIFGIKYDLANLIGKKDSTETFATNEYGLLDKAYGSHSARNIGFMQFYAGVSFYLMQPKRMVKK